MSRDRPDVAEILKTIEEFLVRLVDGLDGRDRYEALCARYLLEVARRELDVGADMDISERRDLEAFLGESGSTDDLYAKLAASIRSGKSDSRWEKVFDLVFRHVVNKVAISRPEQLEPGHRDPAS